MLLSINPQKVKEEIAKGCRDTCKAFNTETPDVYTMVLSVPADLEEARQRLLSLRQKLIDKGVPPLSADELEQKIDDIRGRK